MNAQPARKLGSYQLIGELHAGSMGTLHRAVDSRSQREVVIKTAREDEVSEAALRAEAQVLGDLRHPNIVTLLDQGDAEGHFYLVLEHVDGESLQQRFDRGEIFSVARAIEIMTQLLEALQFAHDRQVLHRDIKPANILLTHAGPREARVKLADFGLARHASGATDAGADSTDLVLGTPGYIAPENYRAGPFDARGDLFAAGAAFYQLLAGRPPMTGSAAEIMFKALNISPPPPSEAGAASACKPFDEVVLRALARDPRDRFQTAAAFSEALRRAFENYAALTAPLPAR